MTNRIDYSSFTREEFLSLITLKYDPELLTRKDCENLSRIYIDFADISKEDLMNMAISGRASFTKRRALRGVSMGR